MFAPWKFERNEAYDIYTEFLGGSADVDLTKCENRLDALNDTIARFKAKVPIQNVVLLSVPPSDRKIPTWLEIKKDILNGRGTIGSIANVFANALFRALGFRSHLTRAVTYGLESFHGYHIIVILRDLVTPGDSYVVDVGNECPNFTADCLDFPENSVVFTHSYLEYKYAKKDQKVLRLHNRGKHNSRAQIDSSLDGFYVYYDFEVAECTEDHILTCLSQIYSGHPHSSLMHRYIKASVYTNLHAVMIKDDDLYVENQNHRLEVTELLTRDAVIKAFALYFPCINPTDLMKALLQIQGGTSDTT